MSITSLTNIDPTSLLLKGDDVKRTFEKEWLIRLFAKHKDLPQSDVLLFLHKAQLTGANPILDHIYLTERNTKVSRYGEPDRWEKRGTVIFSYQFLNAKANETGEFDDYTKETGPKKRFNPFAKNSEDQWKEELCSSVTVIRKGKKSTYDAWWSEYFQDNTQWRSKPYLMLEKCAFAGALRLAFPETLSGIYIADEMKDEDFDAEIEKRRNAEAIETTVSKTIERAEEIKTKIESPELMDQIEATVKMINSEMGILTKGMDLGGKGKAMSENLGVNRFADLKTKSLEELELKLKNLRAINEEKISRDQKVADINANATSEVKTEALTPEVEKAKSTTKKPLNEKPSFTLNEMAQ